MASGWTTLFLTLTAMVFFTKSDQYISRVWTSVWYVSGIAVLAAVRTVFAGVVDALAPRGRFQSCIVVVGDGETAAQTLRDLAKADPKEIGVLGFFNDLADTHSPHFVEGFRKTLEMSISLSIWRESRKSILSLSSFRSPVNSEF